MRVRCAKCSKPIDDHSECPTCGKHHCDLEICPLKLKKALGPMRTSLPRCKHCEMPLGRKDSKGIWRPLPRVLGKSVVCSHCKKVQEANG